MRRRHPHAIVGPLLPPSTPSGLPHGLERGGIFEADYVPPTYIDAVRMTVPTDSPVTTDVSMDVFMTEVPFSDPTRPRMITSDRPLGQAPGFARHYTSYDRGHRHHLDLPMRGMGQMIQGMGPQPGFELESADAPPLPIRRWAPVATPHGTTEGGIFGRRHVIEGMATGGRVRGVRTMEVIDERSARPLTGYGAGPDGIGGCGGGCGGGW